jgi:predicted nuclease with TOPRIM domain
MENLESELQRIRKSRDRWLNQYRILERQYQELQRKFSETLHELEELRENNRFLTNENQYYRDRLWSKSSENELLQDQLKKIINGESNLYR